MLLIGAVIAVVAVAAWEFAPVNRPAEPAPQRPQPADTPANTPANAAASGLDYPETNTVAEQDDYFGTTVRDPYRWLEEEARESILVTDWIERQNRLTFAYLDTLEDRFRIEARLRELWNYEKFSVPVKKGGRYFYRRNDGLQNQHVLLVQNSLAEEPRVLLDPNSWSTDGTVALAGFLPSPDGEHVVYAVQDGGSDWRSLHVLDTSTGKVLDDHVQWVKFSGLAWAPGGQGFFYSRYPEPEGAETFQALNYDQALYFHQLGTPQARDKRIFARPDDGSISVRGQVVDERFLIITMSRGTDARYEVTVLDLAEPDAKPQPLITGFENDYEFFAADGRVLYALTNRGAPRHRVVAIDLDAPAPDNWRAVIEESEHPLVGASLVGGVLLLQYLEDVKTVVRRAHPDGQPRGEVTLPAVGSASGFDGRAEDPETFFSFSSYNAPTAIYRYDAATNAVVAFRQPQVPFDPSAYRVGQVFYQSADGTEVPMFIAHRQDLNMNGGVPTILYGYGGFDVALRPGFSLTALAWMEMGGVYAVANLRGGGEYGKAWHDAGRLHNKQNVFDDFVAAAEYLVANGYTTPDQLGVLGRSNGGLLVGAVVNQRPDLFAVALPAVGVMDMLRFDQFTAGRFWRDDYGSPSTSRADFENNYAFSPYHNIRDGVDYPAMLVTTADTDDRVVPGHSFKYAAALQAAQTGSAPKLIRVETRAGHGAGKPTAKIIEEYADMWAFLAEHTGLKLDEAYGH